MGKLQYWLDLFISDPKESKYIFNLALEYEKLGQTASAAGYYLRSIEYGKDVNQNYEALLKIALCFERQSNRVFTLKGTLLRAIALLPKRPEAYFLLARVYERNKDWQECYMMCTVAYDYATDEPNTTTDVEYPGKYGFIFEKAVAAYWIGLFDQSIHLMRELKQNYILAPIYENAVNDNIARLGMVWKAPSEYTHEDWNKLKFKFNNSHKIQKNYSQCYQDLFVLSVLNGKRDGTYLEIGCADPLYGNNTALLEKEFGWSGTSIDMDSQWDSLWEQQGRGGCLTANALEVNYEEYLTDNYIIDYLQVDCDPPTISYEVLQKLPLHIYKFRVITFEHDWYNDETHSIRDKSRKYLKSFGYELVVPDVAVNEYSSFEDWWVHPDLVDSSIVQLLKSTKPINPANQYIYID